MKSPNATCEMGKPHLYRMACNNARGELGVELSLHSVQRMPVSPRTPITGLITVYENPRPFEI